MHIKSIKYETCMCAHAYTYMQCMQFYGIVYAHTYTYNACEQFYGIVYAFSEGKQAP